MKPANLVPRNMLVSVASFALGLLMTMTSAGMRTGSGAILSAIMDPASLVDILMHESVLPAMVGYAFQRMSESPGPRSEQAAAPPANASWAAQTGHWLSGSFCSLADSAAGFWNTTVCTPPQVGNATSVPTATQASPPPDLASEASKNPLAMGFEFAAFAMFVFTTLYLLHYAIQVLHALVSLAVLLITSMARLLMDILSVVKTLMELCCLCCRHRKTVSDMDEDNSQQMSPQPVAPVVCPPSSVTNTTTNKIVNNYYHTGIMNRAMSWLHANSTATQPPPLALDGHDDITLILNIIVERHVNVMLAPLREEISRVQEGLVRLHTLNTALLRERSGSFNTADSRLLSS